MHELVCPSCGGPSQYDLLKEKLLICHLCSKTFRINVETGQKEIFGDHYIIPNAADTLQIKNIALEWLKRIHHNPNSVDKEFIVFDIKGSSVPYWVVSMDAHTVWQGLTQRRAKSALNPREGSDYLDEKGQFHRSYRWAICARRNMCESWGIIRLHEPQEKIKMEWDGFPLDSTFSRGQLVVNQDGRTAYDSREFFDFKYSNGLAILPVQVDEQEALRRARSQVDLYHYKVSKLHCDYLVDHRTELEIAGIQLIHLPFWWVSYIYKPTGMLRHLYKPKPRSVLIEGSTQGVLKGELALVPDDKMSINSIVAGVAAAIFLLLSVVHPAFFLVSLSCCVIGAISWYLRIARKHEREEQAQKAAELGFNAPA